MENPLISVIVPVYNAEKFLGSCIESVIAQNYRNFELILVDDGSKDLSSSICDDYAGKDLRVRAVHKINGGVSSARNAGLLIAKGEYIAFIDSDDTVGSMYFMNLYKGIQEGTDIVCAGCTIIKPETVIERSMIPCFCTGDDFDDVLRNNYISTAPWAKLFRKETIDNTNLRFQEEISMGEDAIFVYTYLSHASGISIVNDTSYRYNNVPNCNALTQRFYPFDKELLISSLVNEAIDNLMHKKNIHSSLAISHLNDVKCIYKNRTIKSIYSTDRSLTERLALLHKVEIEHLWLYSLKQDGFKPWLLSRLLKYKMLRSYDLICNYAAKKSRKANVSNF